MAVDINTPDPGHWRDIIPESQETLRDVSYVGGRLVGEYLSETLMIRYRWSSVSDA